MTEMQMQKQHALGMMMLFGASGRIGDIIGKVGYRKLTDSLEKPDYKRNPAANSNAENIELLHKYTGWMLAYLGRET